MNQAVESSNLDAAATAEGLADAAARWLRPADLRPWSGNPRRNEPAVPRVLASLERFGFVAPIVVWQSAGRMVAGHTRLRAAEELLRRDPSWRAKGAPAPGLVRVVFHEFASEAEADAYAIADNKLAEIAEWDDVALAEHVKRIEQEDASLLQAAGFVDEEVARLLEAADADAQIEQQEQRAQLERSEQEAAQQEKQQAAVRTLAERFGVPPFSVLDARQGYWQERKRAWLSLGIKSEVGRGTNLLGHNGARVKSLEEQVKHLPESTAQMLVRRELRARIAKKLDGGNLCSEGLQQLAIALSALDVED